MARVAGKVVVVTGAGQGQGAAEARLLAAEGATVLGCDLKPEPAEDLAGVEYRQMDVTDAAGWTALADVLRTRFGRVDGLVANAGITWRARLADLDPTTWHGSGRPTSAARRPSSAARRSPWTAA
jgi:NAD(P)-dependent dehydrogenase (short-subunit alcohol dehydrogenase family)